jgi:serine/threonine-protein kinase
LKREREQRYVSAVMVGNVCLGLGQNDEAMSWMKQAADERDGLLTFAYIWFGFDPLRSDPRFQALLRRMNFPSAGETGAVQ